MHLIKIATVSVAIFITIFGAWWSLQYVAKADGVSWTSSGTINYSVDEDQGRPYAAPPCVSQKVRVEKYPNRMYTGESDVLPVCVYDQGNFRYAQYQRSYYSWPSHRTETGIAVGIGRDTKMYPITSQNNLPDFIPNSGNIVYSDAASNSGWGNKLEIYKDGLSRLTKNGNIYTLDRSLPDFVFKQANGYVLPVGGVDSSNNGKWLVFQAIGIGIMRLDLDTYELKRVSSLSPSFGHGSNPAMEFAISDDGGTLIVGGSNTPFTAYSVNDNCGDLYVSGMNQNTPMSAPCPERALDSEMLANRPGFTFAHDITLSKDRGELRFRANYWQAGHAWTTLRAPGYTSPAPLDYLALGDSFASGEGDIHWIDGNRINHYLSGTDIVGDYEQGIPREKCHISSRSYPFQLATLMQVDANYAKSVACSGAKRIDVQGYDVQRETDIYEGQEVNISGVKKPRLADLANIGILQANAKESFIPGRVQQIEFVESNKPKVATISMGGNDIGFGDVIVACVSKIVPTSTCSQAEGEGKAVLGKSIRGQFTNLRDMYIRLKEASQGVKLYVTGYPQFISNTNSTCILNVPLNTSERTMMVEGVKYLNDVIKAAVAEAGVGYIDIEDSLGEHVLCGLESEKYVSGIFSLGESQEMFHPNASGHAAIYQTIADALNGQSLEDNVCNDVIVCANSANATLPPVPNFFAEPVSTYNWVVNQAEALRKMTEGAVEVVTDSVEQAVEAAVRLSPTSFQPASTVTVELHSEPVELGNFGVADDGSLDADIMIPEDVPVGYHTLHIYGYSYSGEPIDYYQIIQVEDNQ